MIMIDHFRCDKCKATYKGVFRFTLNGEVNCIDCKDRVVYGEVVWEYVTNEKGLDEDVLHDTVVGMLFEDIERIYRSESEVGEDYTEKFIEEDGSINEEKLYFCNNPIDLVIEGQKIAYSALRYMESSKKDYVDIAKKLVKKYKMLRERKFSEKEVQELWDLYFSEETMGLLGEDEEWL